MRKSVHLFLHIDYLYRSVALWLRSRRDIRKMRLSELHSTLEKWDRKGRRVFTVADLRKIFPEGSYEAFLVQLRKFSKEDKLIPGHTLQEKLEHKRRIEAMVIRRAARGVYVYNRTSRPLTNLPEEIAKNIRRGWHNYVSLECALSEHGWISQIPVGRLTVMTTGRSGVFKTPWADIEFTHTHQPWSDFYEDLQDVNRPLKIAKPERALRDLNRVGRNVALVTPEIEEEDFDAELQ